MRELLAVQDRMNRLFETAMTRTNFSVDGGPGAWTPVADAWETREGFFFSLEIPGVAMDQIVVRVDGDSLLVEGERRMERERPGEQFHRVEGSYGKFARRFELPSGADRSAAAATYADGVLTVRFPRSADGSRGSIRLEVR
jgi:HSP20 family protein